MPKDIELQIIHIFALLVSHMVSKPMLKENLILGINNPMDWSLNPLPNNIDPGAHLALLSLLRNDGKETDPFKVFDQLTQRKYTVYNQDLLDAIEYLRGVLLRE